MTDQAQFESPGHGSLAEEAAIWFARMRGPEAERHRPAFEVWLADGAHQRAAYNRAAEIFSMGKFLEHEPMTSVAPAGCQTEHQRAAWFKRGVLATGCGAVALLAAWFAGLPGLTGADQTREVASATSPDGAIDLQTAADVTRVARLADGSIVTLAPASRLRVRFGEARELSLDHGRARFQVAHEARPFIVNARGTLVTARGTVFDVSIEAQQRVTVHLLQGLVDVERPSRSSKRGPTERLRPGQSLVVSAMAPPAVETASRVGAADVESVTPSPTRPGLRDFDAVALGDLIDEANKSARVPIRLADGALRNLRISGRFDPVDSVELAERTAAVFDLEIDRSDPTQLILRSRR